MCHKETLHVHHIMSNEINADLILTQFSNDVIVTWQLFCKMYIETKSYASSVIRVFIIKYQVITKRNDSTLQDNMYFSTKEWLIIKLVEV